MGRAALAERFRSIFGEARAMGQCSWPCWQDSQRSFDRIARCNWRFWRFDISWRSHGTQTIIDRSGELFVKGASSALECIVLAKKSAAGMGLEAPCTVVDSSGDKTFILYRTQGGDLTAGGGAQGTIEIVGGTGKYSALTGKCAYQISYVPGNRGVTTQRCTWQKP